MAWRQTKAFNTAKGGNKKGFCLQNVRLGYGAPAKYATATEAWNHTQQHKDRNIPKGIDVPLFYSYTATIDGLKANYGHVNVQLANGKVWSDGVVYASLAAYEKGHTPKFLGWGESINDYRVIQNVAASTVAVQIKPIMWNVRTSPTGSVRGLVVGGQKYDATIGKDGWARINFRNAPGYIGPSAYKRI